MFASLVPLCSAFSEMHETFVGDETKPSSLMDHQWLKELDTPQPDAVSAAVQLKLRARDIASSLGTAVVSSLAEIDMVVSGGGNFDGYYLGVHMVLSRLEAAANGGAFKIVRWAGVSAGGMMPYEFVLKGENATLVHHLDYGLLCGCRIRTQISFELC